MNREALKKVPEVLEVHSYSGVVVCNSDGHHLFTVYREEKSDKELLHKVAYMISAYQAVHGCDWKAFKILQIPTESFAQTLRPLVVDILKTLEPVTNITPKRISRRQKDVLDLLCQGMANKLIADRLNISERTVKFHVSCLFGIYSVGDRVSLMNLVKKSIMVSAIPDSSDVKFHHA